MMDTLKALRRGSGEGDSYIEGLKAGFWGGGLLH